MSIQWPHKRSNTKGETRPKLGACYVYANLTSNKWSLVFSKFRHWLPKASYKTICIIPFQRSIQPCVLSWQTSIRCLRKKQCTWTIDFSPSLLHISGRNLPLHISRLRALNPNPLLQRALHPFNEPQNHSALSSLYIYICISSYQLINKLYDLHLILTEVNKQQQKLIKTFLYLFKMS